MKLDVSVTGVGAAADRQNIARLRAAIERRRRDARRLWRLRSANVPVLQPREADAGDSGEGGGR